MAKAPKPKPEKKSKEKAAKGAKADSAKEAMGEGNEGMEGEGMAPAKKKMAGKTLVLFIVLPALIILGGGGATAFFLLSKPKAEQHASAENPEKAGEHKPKKDKKDKKAKDGHAKPGKEGEGGASAEIVEGADGVLYYKMPDLLVNITTGDGRPVYLKLKLTVETHSEEAIAAIEPNLPRVLDQYQGFLRELRVDDIAGSAGAYRLRLELLRRVNLAIAPAQADQVLIEEMLVQ
jgi:flagellar protein FliL